MPRGWQRFRVWLKGEDEPIEVQTSARDFTAIPMDPAQGVQPIDMSYRAVHAALLRTGHTNVPRDYDSFIDEVLDGFPEVLDEDTDALRPTDAAR
jgi:hypothetical protein